MRMTLALSLALALLCLLHAGAAAAVPDRSEIAGKWYVVALASNTEFFLREKGNMKMAMVRISFPREDELEVSYAVPKPTGCRKWETTFKKISDSGEVYYSEEAKKTVEVLDTDYKSYAVIFATRVKDGRTLHMMRLYSRSREVSPAVAATFRKLARERSYTDEMVTMLPSQDECSVDEV
ncbi:extracellular fatty acid-binding protein [Lagopus muta]|uniref:extracellular fatty acid-binding protein n=1 Tax=Lagopus muta TaxID=64668 RepID=UPI0020A0C9B3|nr:extracellular fatty acid-binding protein [Lagopus muta]XP_048822112.1 extracellular fatty acid-binding protein [Lagopus muta]